MSESTPQNDDNQVAEQNPESPPSETKVKCEICGKLYASRKSLKIHFRIHTGEKPYACHLCPKRFTQTNVLKAHLNFHAGRRDWICIYCNKAFTQSAHLRTHLKTHSTIQKAHECHHCQKRFSSKGVRDRHQRQHTGEKPYNCPMCTKKFTRTESLKHHLNSHKGIRPYSCPFEDCIKRFTKKSSLIRHCRFTEHGDMDSNHDTASVVSAYQNSPKITLSQSSTPSSRASESLIPGSPLIIKAEEMDENGTDEVNTYRRIVERLTDAQLERLGKYLELALDDVSEDGDGWKATQSRSPWTTSRDKVQAKNPFADNEELLPTGGRTVNGPPVLGQNASGPTSCHSSSNYAMYNGHLLEGHLLDSAGSVPVCSSSCRYSASQPCTFDGPPTYYSFN